jgi:hypothetical protein
VEVVEDAAAKRLRAQQLREAADQREMAEWVAIFGDQFEGVSARHTRASGLHFVGMDGEPRTPWLRSSPAPARARKRVQRGREIVISREEAVADAPPATPETPSNEVP